MNNIETNKVRIVRIDSRNYEVQQFVEVATKKKVGNTFVETGEVKREWTFKGYYGKLDMAIRAAIDASFKDDTVITQQALNEAVKTIVEQTNLREEA